MGPKGIPQKGSQKEHQKRSPMGPKGIPHRGDEGDLGWGGSRPHLLIFVPGERLGRQHEPILLGAALHDADVVDGQPTPADHLRRCGAHGAVMGQPQPTAPPPPPPHPTHCPTATASGSSRIPTPQEGVGGSQHPRKELVDPKDSAGRRAGPPEAPRPRNAHPQPPPSPTAHPEPTEPNANNSPTTPNGCSCSVRPMEANRVGCNGNGTNYMGGGGGRAESQRCPLCCGDSSPPSLPLCPPRILGVLGSPYSTL